MFPCAHQQLSRYHVTGKADYMCVVTGTTTQDLFLADFTNPGQKEAFAHGSHVFPVVQEEMMTRLRLHPMGFMGWMSTHDRHDRRMEICLFPEHVSECLGIERAYVIGP